MRIGIPTEVKSQEYRVAVVPEDVATLCQQSHTVLVQRGAGQGSGFDDEAYRRAGATIVDSAQTLFAEAELIVKVKEPQPGEYALLRPEHTLFCYLHLAPAVELTDALVASGASCVAYETITDPAGRLPLLMPMSEIAGRLATQAGAHCLEKAQGGAGVLLGSVVGLPPAKVLIFGGGTVGTNAAEVAVGMGASVTVIDPNDKRRQQLQREFAGADFTVLDAPDLASMLPETDLVIGAVLLPGAESPKVLQRSHLSALKPGSVLVDVAVDQGGCFATTRPTTHGDPTFVEEGIVHYCVANIPSAVARTASQALSSASRSYLQQLASGPLAEVLAKDAHLLAGLNVAAGKVCFDAVASAQGRDYTPPEDVLALIA